MSRVLLSCAPAHLCTTRAALPQKPKGSRREAFKSKDWILKKKESQRKQGQEVRQDSKYTARNRRRLT